MIIGVDARSLQTARGVWRYVASTLDALAAVAPEHELRLLVPGDRPLLGAPEGPNVTIVRPRTASRRFYASSALLHRPLMDRALGADLDVFWIPASNAGAVSGDVPVVLTVHDLSFVFRPGDFTASDRLNHRVTRPRRQAEVADRVLVTTEAVRRDVVGTWNIAPDRVDVVTPGTRRPAWFAGAGAASGPPAGAVDAARARYGVPERYFLQVGALEPRKRPDLLVHALERADVRADAVLVGAGRLAPTLDRPGVHLTGWVPEADLDLLYAGALALVYPSMLEGYGFPPQEAALCGTPAIVSDLPALREVLGDDGARFVEPGDENGLAVALRELEDDDALRARLARSAYAVAEPRTWDATARGVLATFTRAAGGSTPA